MSAKDVLSWPKKPGNNFNPWWVILWRGLWVIPFFISFSITSLILLIGNGPAAARQLWKDWT